MENQTLRTIIFYKNYYLDFYNTLSNSSRKKINQVLVYLRDHYQVPNNAVKHITNSSGIYEIRCTEGSNEYRVLFFFEEGTLISGGKIVILCNGFIKKNGSSQIFGI
jgi:phage-related protein